jgi:hypothetical protein
MKFMALFLLPCLSLYPQQTVASQAETKGTCSPANTGNNNTFNITCQGISIEQGRQFLSILNRISMDQIPTKEVLTDLEEIKTRLSRIQGAPLIAQHSEGANSPNTVNINQRLPGRRIPPDKIPEIRDLLKQHPAKIRVSAVINNGEAYLFAQDWYDVLKASGWEMLDDHVLGFLEAGAPIWGIMIKLHGVGVKPNEPFMVPRSSPAAALGSSLAVANVFQTLTGQRYPEMPDGELRLEIHMQPEQ